MTATQPYETSVIDRVFGVILEKQTYKNIAYLLLSLPLGLLYFLIIVPGLSISLPLLFVVVGFPWLLAILLVSDQLLNFERFLLRSVLGHRVVVERPRLNPERRIFARLGERLAQGYTWRGLLYLLLRLGMGVISFALVVTLVPVSLLLVTLPLTYQWIPVKIHSDLMVTNIDQAMLGCSLGAVLVLASAHVFNAWTRLWKRVAGVLLA